MGNKRNKYRSKFEQEVGRNLPGWKYEPIRIPYVTSHNYTPDFKRRGKVLIEVKGRFRTSSEAAKYIAIRECNPKYEIVFIFQNPETPMPGARRRKDGTKHTVSQWADKNQFRWFTLETMKEIK